jgi:transposase-like protein
MTVAEAVRQIGVTQQTFYRWRKLYGGMGRSQLARLIFPIVSTTNIP